MNEEDYIERREDREFETMKDQYQEQLNKFSELLQDFAENNLGATDCKECNELCHTIMPLDNKTYEGKLKGLFDSILVLSGNVPHPKEEFIENVFEIAFGDNAINKDFSEKEVLEKLREFSDKLLGDVEDLSDDDLKQEYEVVKRELENRKATKEMGLEK